MHGTVARAANCMGSPAGIARAGARAGGLGRLAGSRLARGSKGGRVAMARPALRVAVRVALLYGNEASRQWRGVIDGLGLDPRC